MKTICDVCESAPAILFCAADEAALCRSCDDKVHKCNKLASRHVRVGLAVPSEVPRCDICENAPAFFYCEIDGSSLCLQCDMIVHVGGKRTHSRYLLLRQKVEFLGDKLNNIEDPMFQPMDQVNDKKEDQLPSSTLKERLHGNQNSISQSQHKAYDHVNMDSKMIDLNARPLRMQGQPSSTRDAEVATGNGHEDGVVPLGSVRRNSDK